MALFASGFVSLMVVGCSGGAFQVAAPQDDADDGAADSVAVDSPTTDTGGDVETLDAATDSTVTDGTVGDGTVDDSTLGAPSALFGATALNFGLSDCGGAAAGPKSLTISNAGGAALHVTASMLVGTSFSITSATTLTIAPKSSAKITVAPAAVPATATAATVIDDALTLTTDDPDNPTVSVPVMVTASGATLSITPATLAFGSTTLDTPATSIPFTLTNSGNQSVNVAFGAVTDPEYTVTGTLGDVGPAESMSGLLAEFTPTAAVTIDASVPLIVTGTVCGGSITSIPLTGAGVTGAATVSGDLSFGTSGFSPCGGLASNAQTISIGNTGSAPFTWTASLAGTAQVPTGTGGTQPMYSLSTVGGTIDPGDPASTISVSTLGIPFPSAVPGSYGDTVTITTNIAGDTPKLVHLNQAAQGAILALDTTNIAFGSVAKGTSQSSTFKVTNNGNANAAVTLSSTNATFAVSPSTATTLTAGDSETGSLIYTPTDASTQSTQVGVAVGANDVLCQPLPSALTASGTGLSGGVGLDVSTLDFGRVDCGATAGSKTFTLTNTGTAALAWTTSLGKGTTSPYVLTVPGGASPSSGSLAAGGAITFTVTPSAIPSTSSTSANSYGDVVTITTDIVGDTAHTVTLKETAQGAILYFVPPLLDLGQVPLSGSSSGSFALQNKGNAGADVALVSSGSMFVLTGLGSDGTIQAPSGASTNVGVTFSPGSTAASEEATVTPMTKSVLCGALPAPMQLTGTGVTGHVSYSPASLDFGSTNCGAAASAQTITFSNLGGTADYHLTAATFGTSGYTISPEPSSSSPIDVPQGSSVTLTVSPVAIPATSAITPNLYGDTLTVTTDISGDTAKTINVTQTAQGAILGVSTSTIAFGGVTAGSDGAVQFTLSNTGNASGNVIFTDTQPTIFELPATTVAPSASPIVSATFTPAAVTGYSDTASVSVDSSTVLCQPLAVTSIALSGSGTAGALATLSATSLTFGNVDLPSGTRGTFCGTAAGAKSLTVTSKAATTAAKPLTYTLGLGASSPYTVALSGTNPLPPGGVITVTVTPTNVPTATTIKADGLSDTLTITSGIAGDSPYSVQLHQTAAGVVLTFSPTTLALTTGAFGKPSGSFTLTNSGDLPTTVALASSDSTDFTVSPTSANATLMSAVSGTVTFKPATLGIGPRSSTISVQVTTNMPGATTPLPTCGTALPTIAVTGMAGF